VAILKKYTQEGIPQNQRYKYSDAVNIGNEPIIQKDIPVNNSQTYQTSARLGRALDDLKRISTLFTQGPGLKFIGNEAALTIVGNESKRYWKDQSKPKDQRGISSFNFEDSLATVGGVASTLATTLLQVPVNGTGTHFVKGDIGGVLDIFKGALKPVINPIDVMGGNLTKVITSNEDNTPYERDIIKFRFTIVKPTGDDNTPIEYRYLNFKAFLTQLDDSFNGDWNSWKYNGRAENFYTYSGFERKVSLGFKIAAESKDEMAPLYSKMVELASVTAPTYTTDGTMKGNFVKVTVGDYLYNIPGIITDVSFNWSPESQWDLGLNSLGEADEKHQQLPTVMDCSLTFTPIHEFVPQQGFVENQKSYFITKKTDNFDIAKQPGVATNNNLTGTVDVGIGEFGSPFGS